MLQALLRMVKVAEYACVEALFDIESATIAGLAVFDRKCNDSWIGSCRLNRGRRLA